MALAGDKRAIAQLALTPRRPDFPATAPATQVGGPPPMMRIDAWTHFIPKPFAVRMAQIAGNFADIGKIAGDVRHPVREGLRNEVCPCVDTHHGWWSSDLGCWRRVREVRAARRQGQLSLCSFVPGKGHAGPAVVKAAAMRRRGALCGFQRRMMRQSECDAIG